MWSSTPSSKTEHATTRRRLLAGLTAPALKLAMAATLGSAAVPPAWATRPDGTAQTDTAPAPLSLEGRTLWPRGQGTLKFFGLDIYRAQLWTESGFDPARYASHWLALELTYERRFTAREIATRSLQEMERQTSIQSAVKADWTHKLAQVLPDVAPGDRLLGLHRPGQGASFRTAQRALGQIDDPQFAALFFGIWLSPATSEPSLRAALLGQAGARP